MSWIVSPSADGSAAMTSSGQSSVDHGCHGTFDELPLRVFPQHVHMEQSQLVTHLDAVICDTDLALDCVGSLSPEQQLVVVCGKHHQHLLSLGQHSQFSLFVKVPLVNLLS